tara:strand:+ start:683 stop:1435 length:753 start_codon:yes stop_codon:yes gene_type:complete
MDKNKIYTVYGINSAKAVLQSGECFVRKIFLDYNSAAYKDPLIKKFLSDDSKKYVINNISLANNEVLKNERRLQGIVVVFSFSGIKESVMDLFNDSEDNDCILILDQLEDPQNLGQIIRTSECAGVNKIILTKNKSVKLSDSVFQVSQGAFSDISFYICTNLRNTLNILKENDYWLVALENSIDSDNWCDIDLKGKIGIILGSEGKGIRRLTLEDADFKATIPMQGSVNSLNVSATCSAILFERLRQIIK